MYGSLPMLLGKKTRPQETMSTSMLSRTSAGGMQRERRAWGEWEEVGEEVVEVDGWRVWMR